MPFLFKLAVDWLSAITGSGSTLSSFADTNSILLALFVSPIAVLVGYGIARTGAAACNGSFSFAPNYAYTLTSLTPFFVYNYL